MSLRWRIALGFALVALATAAVIALATPPIVSQGFSDIDYDNDGGQAISARPRHLQPASSSPTTRAPGRLRQPPRPRPRRRPRLRRRIGEQRPGPADHDPETDAGRGPRRGSRVLVRLACRGPAGQAAHSARGSGHRGVARGDLGQRSGLADRTDEFGQLGRTFDSMAGQLQLAEETRRRFLQDSAHELKTPLAVIEATSSAMIDGVYTPERRHLETIRDQSRVLARIVDDLRTISLAEGGHLPLRPAAAGRSSRARLRRRRLRGPRRGRSSEALGPGPGRAHRRGRPRSHPPDRRCPRRQRPASHACRRLGADGRVGVDGPGHGCRRAVPPRPVVRLAVEDSGPGIPVEALPRIFERFYQADPSRSRGTGTSGLGLSIVKALAEAHGGRAGAENRPEGGARLWIELPATRSGLA